MPGNIHVLLFDDYDGADRMLANVNTWEEKGWLKVEDAVVATRGTGSAQAPAQIAMPNAEQPMVVQTSGGNTDLQVKQTHKQGGKYALGGGGIGLLAGLLLGGPIGGLVVGATVGGLTGALRDYGIEDKFIDEISAGLQPGTSALFLMTSGGDDQKILAELRPHKARLVKTTLPPEQEKALREALEQGD